MWYTFFYSWQCVPYPPPPFNHWNVISVACSLRDTSILLSWYKKVAVIRLVRSQSNSLHIFNKISFILGVEESYNSRHKWGSPWKKWLSFSCVFIFAGSGGDSFTSKPCNFWLTYGNTLQITSVRHFLQSSSTTILRAILSKGHKKAVSKKKNKIPNLER